MLLKPQVFRGGPNYCCAWACIFHRTQGPTISGLSVLEKTGTPVDRTVIVNMEAIEAIHVDWKSGAKTPGQSTPVEVIRQMDLTLKAVTAALIGVKSPFKPLLCNARSTNTQKNLY